MRVYLDTGVFVDHLIYRSHAGNYLRTKGRRNRSIQQLSQDVSECLEKISRSHDGFTSSLTLYEVEDAMFEILQKSSKGIPDRNKYLILSCRCLISQVMITKESFKLNILDLSETTIKKITEEMELQRRGVRAADSLHMATAILNNIDLIVSTDKHILNLNNVFNNNNGVTIQCLDTDKAKLLL